MRTTTRVATIAVAAAAVLSVVPAAFGQFANDTTGNTTGNVTGGTTGNTTGGSTGGTTGNTTGSFTASTGPGAPLTAGTTTGAPVAMGGGAVETEPLATTGGGDLAFAVGSLVAAGGLGLRLFVTRRR